MQIFQQRMDTQATSYITHPLVIVVLLFWVALGISRIREGAKCNGAWPWSHLSNQNFMQAPFPTTEVTQTTKRQKSCCIGVKICPSDQIRFSWTIANAYWGPSLASKLWIPRAPQLHRSTHESNSLGNAPFYFLLALPKETTSYFINCFDHPF